MHRTTGRFWKCFERLPETIQRVSKQKFELLKKDPSHASLHFKKIGRFWSVRAGLNYRALALEDGGDFIWVWISNHDEYEHMVKELG
ncbi:MAG: hypothetical protein M1470_14045 [Bacteroidetes bacterium]|nr:hypothetical protein [Bacteroidota bacterium]MCL5738166.1 hypothetical protein [Bacteroidota bacterium]